MGDTTLFVTDNDRPDLGGNIRHGYAHTFSPLLWDYLINRFAITSMLDVGCGEGHAVRFFQRRDVFAHGIDGLPQNIRRAVIPIALHDLLQRAYVMPVDLVWSCEVAEHIDPEKVDHFIDTLTNGQIIAMTHALPGQGGHNHVNCQPPDYWIDRITARGYILSPELGIFRDIATKEVAQQFFAASGLVFLRK